LFSRLLSRNVNLKTYKTIILSVVWYDCKIWSITLREKHRLRVFKNRVLRRIFRTKMDEVTGLRIKSNNGELNNIYSSPNIIKQIKPRRMRWTVRAASMEEETEVYRVLAANAARNRPLGRPKRRWECGIKIDRRDIGL
jgi:hypothetical protein